MTRAYGRWIEDLTSLPEYQASLRTEREKWLDLQEKATEQRVRVAEDVTHAVLVSHRNLTFCFAHSRCVRP